MTAYLVQALIIEVLRVVQEVAYVKKDFLMMGQLPVNN